jgi:hypothetical protein
MTRPTAMDKDHLAAFVDGELSPEDAAAVVMHLADHPADQAYVDDLMAANAALMQAFAAPLEEPVPPALRDLILGAAPQAQVLPFRAKPRIPIWGGLAAGAALAAALALVAFQPTGGTLDLVPGPLAESSPLTAALAALPMGQMQVMGDGSEVMILSSLPTPNGFCREVEVIDTSADQLEAALACTTGTGWTVEVVITESLTEASAAEGFGTASGAEAQSFAPFLDRIGAGASLTPAEEAAAIARAWTR